MNGLTHVGFVEALPERNGHLETFTSSSEPRDAKN
jgi:hypothetical protein